MKCSRLLACSPPAQGPNPTAGIQTCTGSSCWHHGHTVPPTHGLTLAASNEMYTHSPQIESLTQERVRKEFNRKTGQTALIRRRAQPDKGTDQQPIHTRPDIFTPYSSIFPLLLLPKSPEPIPFPAFGSSPTHPIISLMQSQNALLLHPIIHPTPLGSNTLKSQRCSSIDSSSWMSHLEDEADSWDQPWEGPREDVFIYFIYYLRSSIHYGLSSVLLWVCPGAFGT